MQKAKYYITSFLLAIAFTINAQLPTGPEIVWQRCFGSSGVDYFIDVIKLADSSILTSQVYGFPDGDAEGLYELSVPAILTKFTSDLEIIWQRYFGGNTCGSGITNIIPLPDGTIMTAGGTCSTDGDFTDNHSDAGDIFLLKTDVDGNKLWSRCYGGSAKDYITGCIATQDGGFLITGYTGSSDGDIPFHYGASAFYDALIFKTDSAGNIEWLKVIGGTSVDYVISSVEIDSEKYFFAVASTSDDIDFEGVGLDDYAKVLYFEIDISGNINQKSYYSGDNEIRGYISASKIHDGKVLLVNVVADSSNYVESFGMEDGVIAVLDDSLHFNTIKNFGGSKNDALLRVVADEAGNYYLLGYSYSPDGDLPGNYNDGAYNDYWLMATDHNFNLLWSRNFGGKFNNNKSDVSTLLGNLIVDENYITCFISCVVPDSFPDMDIECGFPSLSSGYTDSWIVRFDLNTVSVQEPSITPDFFTVYPNPTQHQITITMNQDISPCYNNYVVLIDMKGRKLAEAEFNYTYSMDVSNLAPGLYMVLVYCNEFLQYKKIVIQH